MSTQRAQQKPRIAYDLMNSGKVYGYPRGHWSDEETGRIDHVERRKKEALEAKKRRIAAAKLKAGQIVHPGFRKVSCEGKTLRCCNRCGKLFSKKRAGPHTERCGIRKSEIESFSASRH